MRSTSESNENLKLELSWDWHPCGSQVTSQSCEGLCPSVFFIMETQIKQIPSGEFVILVL
jgi:hypothetical protein